MSGACQKCAAHLDGAWKFCPRCGAANVHELHPHLHEHVQPEKAPVKRAFGGLLLGIVAAPVLIIYGTLICLLGPAMVLGIPMIVAGICAPVLAPFIAMNGMKGQCPWCGATVGSVALFDRFNCPACNKRIVVRKSELQRAA